MRYCPFRELVMLSMRYALTHQNVLDKGDGTDGSLYDGHAGQLAVYSNVSMKTLLLKISFIFTSILGTWMAVQGVSPISSNRTSNSANLTAIVMLDGHTVAQARAGEGR